MSDEIWKGGGVAHKPYIGGAPIVGKPGTPIPTLHPERATIITIQPGTTVEEALDMILPDWRSYLTVLDPDPPQPITDAERRRIENQLERDEWADRW